ncbi:hypothetical protein AVEN_68090-1 [Araneus ventricosus]|uniref:Histone-lysine N-methyltransferase SETMAR n=1 Tax=Araneus ventricosus TaxID=182803 RepID=A0A4Y2N714_ARAVE|nr:hypothetical protein AVEN_68090-1 [Araneus ventricosus]
MLPPSASCVVLLAFLKQKIGLWKIIYADIYFQTSRQLRRAILASGVVLIHDNACPHSAVETHEFLGQFKWDVSDHPSYSSDLATSDFHLFSEMKNCLGDQSF